MAQFVAISGHKSGRSEKGWALQWACCTLPPGLRGDSTPRMPHGGRLLSVSGLAGWSGPLKMSRERWE